MEHLHQWLIDAKCEKTPNATNFQKVVTIVQVDFCDGTLAEEIMWHTVVLVPKRASRYFRGVGLVEVFWKSVTSLLNR